MSIDPLAAAREQMDAIDRELVRTLVKRLQVSAQVAAIKGPDGQAVFAAARETAVLAQTHAWAQAALAAGQTAAAADHVRSLMRHVMRLSRALQYELLLPDDHTWQLGAQIAAAPATLPLPTIAVQGGAGSYQSLAAAQLAPHARQRETATFADSCADVVSGAAAGAVLPLENTTAGTVDAVYDLLLRHELYIVGALSLPIAHALLALPGSTSEQIRTVHSHPQALAQCADTIRKQGWQAVAATNTAYAARDVAALADPTVAAIGSPEAARAHGLTMLADNLSDLPSNQTRFVLVARQPAIAATANRVSLILRLDDRSGTLAAVLDVFADRGLNLTKIQSRPQPARPWEYLFYLDFDAQARGWQRAAAQVTLYQLEREYPFVRFLGWYTGS